MAHGIDPGNKMQDERHDDKEVEREGKEHMEATQQLNPPVNTGHCRGHVHTGKDAQNDQLSAITFGKTEQLMQTKAHLGGKKSDRANGAGNHRNHAGRVDAAAKPASTSATMPARVRFSPQTSARGVTRRPPSARFMMTITCMPAGHGCKGTGF